MALRYCRTLRAAAAFRDSSASGDSGADTLGGGRDRSAWRFALFPLARPAPGGCPVWVIAPSFCRSLELSSREINHEGPADLAQCRPNRDTTLSDLERQGSTTPRQRDVEVWKSHRMLALRL